MTKYVDYIGDYDLSSAQKREALIRAHYLKHAASREAKIIAKKQEKPNYGPFLVVAACGALLSLLLLGARGAAGL